MDRRLALIALLGGAAAVVLIVLLSGGDGDEPSSTVATGPAPSARETEKRSVPSGATAGTSRGEQRDNARRRTTREERARRRGPRQQEQGRLGAQTGGSPPQDRGSGAERPGARVATIVVSGGAAVGGVQRVRFEKGERVRLIVQSDSDEVVEIEGYGLRRRVEAGGSARFYFETSKAGLFSIDLVRGRTRIGVLQVD